MTMVAPSRTSPLWGGGPQAGRLESLRDLLPSIPSTSRYMDDIHGKRHHSNPRRAELRRRPTARRSAPPAWFSSLVPGRTIPSPGRSWARPSRSRPGSVCRTCPPSSRPRASSLDKVVSATVIILEEADFAGMNEEWLKWFPGSPPARQGAKLPVRVPGLKVSIAVNCRGLNASRAKHAPLHSWLTRSPSSAALLAGCSRWAPGRSWFPGTSRKSRPQPVRWIDILLELLTDGGWIEMTAVDRYTAAFVLFAIGMFFLWGGLYYRVGLGRCGRGLICWEIRPAGGRTAPPRIIFAGFDPVLSAELQVRSPFL